MLYMVMGRSAPKRAHKFPKYIHDTRNLKVGLMGGSFNPPHEGHFTIAKLALKLFGLDEIWWLISPQNPLKNSYDHRIDPSIYNQVGVIGNENHKAGLWIHPSHLFKEEEIDFVA